MTMLCVGRAAWSKGPPLAPHATPHDEVAKGSPSPKLPEHPIVADPGALRRAGVSLRSLWGRPRLAFACCPAKGNARTRAGMLSVAETRRTPIARGACRPRSAPRYAAPRSRGMSIAIEWPCAFVTAPNKAA